MKKLISQIKRKYPYANTKTIEKAFVISYGFQHLLDYENTVYISKFIQKATCDDIVKFINEKLVLSSLNDIVTVFECLINNMDKKNNGVVYTPSVIRDYIINTTIEKKSKPIIMDPACGCGALLITAAKELHQRFNLSYEVIYSNHIWGCDVDDHSIEKCQVLLELLALQDGEKSVPYKFNLIVGNALEVLDDCEFKNKFDIVIGNPPYVRAKNIDDLVKKTLSKWAVVSGNVDLYIPFYQLGFELLNDKGILGYISPNTYLQSVNGRGLRNYLKDSNACVSIINFKEAQQFIDVTHYTCITIIDKSFKGSIVNYSIYNGSFEKLQYSSYDISNYETNAEWRFGNDVIDKLVFNIEHQPQILDDFNIRNGLATLCNDLYFFNCVEETDSCYIREYNGKKYAIEKDICINIAKPNIMRTEDDLISKGEKAIYPYQKGKIIPESIMKSIYPKTYAFLLEFKPKLMERDKGKVESYPEWYAYGRTQGMHNQGLKVLIPYMADRGVAIISEEYDLLFYCGYAAFADDVQALKLLKIFIESDVFWFYIKMTSKPYSKGFMALAKNYIKNFGIPTLSDSDKTKLISLNGEAREKYIASLYDVDYNTIQKCISYVS